ncbi:MAG: hypothetical protein AAGD22_07405 [Verrucomicrobiota bacterium]
MVDDLAAASKEIFRWEGSGAGCRSFIQAFFDHQCFEAIAREEGGALVGGINSREDIVVTGKAFEIARGVRAIEESQGESAGVAGVNSFKRWIVLVWVVHRSILKKS